MEAENKKIRRPVLRYFGGKWMLAPWIIGFFPPHKTYVEPYGGGGSLLIRKPRAKAEIYNDLDAEIVNVFRVLRDRRQSAKLKKMIELTPFSRDEFRNAYRRARDPVERARRMICLSLMGIGADAVCGRTTGFRSKAMDRRNPALDWLNYPRSIPDFCERLAGVTVENRDALKLMREHDGPDVLFYLDPPYMHETRKRNRRRNYRYEMTNDDHAAMLTTISKLEGMVVLSGYESRSYEKLKWTRFQTDAIADSAARRTESLWLNPAAARAQQQMEMEI